MHCKAVYPLLNWRKTLKPSPLLRVPFSQAGNITCAVLLIRSAVLPMAVIHKNTLFLHTSFKPPYMMQFRLSFFSPSKVKQDGFPLVTSPSFLAPCLALPKVLGKKGKKQKYFLLFLTDPWQRGKGVVFQFETQNSVETVFKRVFLNPYFVLLPPWLQVFFLLLVFSKWAQHIVGVWEV